MGDLNTAQKVQVILDGGAINAASATYQADNNNLSVVGGELIALAAGTTQLTVSADGRTGTRLITIDEAPIEITLGTPVPK